MKFSIIPVTGFSEEKKKKKANLKSIPRSIMRAIKNLGNSVYIKVMKYLDLFNLEKKE